MSQSTLSAPQLSGPAQQLDDYLQRQMRKASAQVRLVDLFTSIMTLLVVFLGTLFLVALIDAWIFELRPWMRFLLLGAIVVSALAYIFVVIVPLSIRRINPVYAAKVVESARPDIKNGLINYLLLRSFGREEKAVSQRVIELVGSRAANDISGLEVSATVDKSNTIRIAMLLVVIVTLLGLYKVFSPKDPFQTFARVIAPFADVARPCVRITDITPGNTTVYFGQPMPVSARINGQFDTDSVNLVYSTTDGQEIDKRVPMRPSETGDGTWVVLLKTDDRGIGHSLDYHIEAGDGESIEYTMLLKSTPMLTIDSITYQPPAYTKLPEQTVTGTSDISALEGTLVTIRSVANTGLQSAAVELLMQRSDSQFDIVNTVSMEIVESKRAECKFRLQLDNKRQAQRYSHYRLNLVTVEGKPGEPAAPCPVRVIPDLPPEIQVLDPTDTELSVPVNSKLRFVIRAQDPDFELTKISVAGDSSVYRVFEQDIPFPRDADLSGQINTRFDLWPKKLKMREGDTILLAFAAFDNRRIASNDAHDPNRTLTANYIVNVTGAIENPPVEKSKDDVEQEDTDNNESADDSQRSDNQQDNPEKGTDNDQKNSENENIDPPAENESDPNDGRSSTESKENDGSKGENDEKSGNEGEGKSNSGENENDNQQSPDSSNSSGEGEESKPGGGTPDESNSDNANDGNANSGNGEKSSTGDNSESESGDSESKPADSIEGGNDPGSDSSTDSPTGGKESPESEADPDGTEQPGQSGSKSQAGEPLDDHAHPGDIIEKINQIREQKEKSGNKSNQPDSGQSKDNANKGESSSKENNSGKSSQDEPPGDLSKPEMQSDSSGGSEKSESESADGASKEGDKSNSGSNKEQTKQNAGQDNQPSNEGSPSTSKDAGEKGSNKDSPSSGGSGDEKQDDKKGSSDGGSDSGDQPKEQDPKPEEKSGGGGGEDQKQQSSGESGSKNESGNPKQSDPSQPTGKSDGKDGESGRGDPGDSGSPESGSSAQGGTKPGEDGSTSSGSKEPGSAPSEQQGTPDGNSQGSSGDQPGSEGSGKESQQPGNSGTSPGDKPGDNPSSQPGKGNSSGESSGGQDFGDQSSNQQGGSNDGGQPGGGGSTGQTSDGNNQAPSQTNIPDSADAANLEYTKQATDLALDYLTQQQVNPDPELLEQLNWTEEELRDFVKRWNELKQRFESGDARQKQEYEQVLRSLGLAPNNADVQQTQVEQDKKKGYQEEGRVPNAPPGFRAFEKRRNRVDKDPPN